MERKERESRKDKRKKERKEEETIEEQRKGGRQEKERGTRRKRGGGEGEGDVGKKVKRTRGLLRKER